MRSQVSATNVIEEGSNKRTVSVLAFIPKGTTTVSGKTCLTVPLINSKAGPEVGVKGAGSRADLGTTDSLTTLFSASPWEEDSGVSKVRLNDLTTGSRIDTMRLMVEFVDSRKSMR